MLQVWKRTISLLVVAFLATTIVAGPAHATTTPPNTKRCKPAKVGDVEAGALLILKAGDQKKSTVLAEALANATLTLCVKADVEANIRLKVESIVDSGTGKTTAIVINARVLAKAAASVFVDATLKGQAKVIVGGKPVLGAWVEVKLAVKAFVAANVLLRANVRLDLDGKK